MALTTAQRQFLDQAAVAAQNTQTEYQVPASVTIAQAVLESAWGTRHIGEANNYFGIKAGTANGQVTFGSIANGYVTVPTREVINGHDVMVQANFRKYASMTDSFRDHGDFLRRNKRYAPAFATTDGTAFARAVAAAGYATDPRYGDTLATIIQQFQLTQYDTPAGAGTPETPASPGTPEGPETPASPETPETPASGDVTEVPPEPGTAEGTDTPAEQDVPDPGTTEPATDPETIETGNETETTETTETGNETEAETENVTGTPEDAGSATDTEAPVDAGSSMDAETPQDTGTPDETEVPSDTETPVDAQTQGGG